MSYYAVAKGRKTGIYRTWAECENQVKGFGGAVFKKFKNSSEAENFIALKSGLIPTQSSSINSKRNFSCSSSSDEPASKKVKNDMTEEEMIKFLLSCDYDEEKDDVKASSSSSNNSSSWQSDKIRMIKPGETNLKSYGGYQFQEDSDGFVHVYTDGSCENNGRRNAIAGLGVYFDENHPLNKAEPVEGRATNNVGEIQAAIRAISLAQSHKIKRLNIFTDSQFLINSVCKWMSAWKAKGWKLSTGKPVVNQTDFKKLDQLINAGNMLIKWSYIAAHQGHEGNEAADKLAKEGAKKYI